VFTRHAPVTVLSTCVYLELRRRWTVRSCTRRRTPAVMHHMLPSPDLFRSLLWSCEPFPFDQQHPTCSRQFTSFNAPVSQARAMALTVFRKAPGGFLYAALVLRETIDALQQGR